MRTQQRPCTTKPSIVPSRGTVGTLYRRATLAASVLAVTVVLAACGTASTPDSVDAYVRALPSWASLSPTQPENDGVPTSEPPATSQIDDGGTLYTCTTKHYSISKNPGELVLATPDLDVMWPGALIEGASHLSGLGSLTPLVVDKTRRGPISISIAGGGVLGIPGGVSDTIDQPAPSTVRESINQLVVNAIQSNVATGAGISNFTSTESFSGTQAAISVGLSGRYLGAKLDASLDYATSASQHTYTAYFIQRLFTVAMDPPQNPSDMFAPDVSAGELRQLGVGPSNLPLYVASVSYGRILMFSLKSTASKKQIEAALQFSYDGVVAQGSAYSEAELQQTLSQSEVKVVAIGGPNTGVENLIKDADLKSYFASSLEINQVEPISLVIKNLADKTVAKVVNTTEYDVRECAPAVALPTPDFWWRGEDSSDLEPNDLGITGSFENNLTYGAGRFGKSFSLDGVSAYVASYQTPDPNSEYLLHTTGAFTVSAWVNPSLPSNTYGTIVAEIGKYYEAGNFSLGVWANGTVSFHRRALDTSAVAGVTTPSGAAPANQWSLVTAVYGGAAPGEPDLRIYVNGVYRSGNIYAGSIPTTYSDGRTRVGTRGYDSNVVHAYPYKGYIDEVMLFERALGADEIASMNANFEKMIP